MIAFAGGTMLNIFKLTNEKFISILRRRGAIIGENTVFFSPENTHFDINKAFLIKIGNYCKITSGVTIIAHDYSRSVARRVFKENVGGSAPVTIGDNCFIGMNSIIMMGTEIGDNCIIGAGSVVKGNFPQNSVIAGNPARLICSLDEYFLKRKSKCISEAVACVKHIYENTGKMPTVRQMGDGFAWLYLPRTQQIADEYPWLFELSADDKQSVKKDFLDTKPEFKSFEDFLNYAKKALNIE